MQAETTSATGADSLESLWRQVSGDIIGPQVGDSRNGSKRLKENRHRSGVQYSTRDGAKAYHRARRKHAVRLTAGNSNAIIRCYHDKPFNTQRPRPASPELQSFYRDEAALASLDVFNIMRSVER